MTKQSAKDFIVKWNYLFPADKWWREKYNVPLFSEQHLSHSQIDIALEYLEEQFYSQLQDKVKLQKEKEEDYKKGKLVSSLEEQLTQEEKDDLFNKIKF